MSKINDGGPAFPMPHVCNANNGTMEWGESGMTLRDWFAGQALTGLLARDARITEYELLKDGGEVAVGHDDDGNVTAAIPLQCELGTLDKDQFADIATAAYNLADAMLAERNKDRV